MYRSVRFLSLALILLVAMSFVAMGQAQFKLPIYITCSGSTMGGRVDTMYFGVGPTNTYGPDVSVVGTFKESQAAPAPPAFYFYSTWQQIPGRTEAPPAGIAASGLKPSDFRGYVAPGQVDTFLLNVKIGPSPATSGSITLTIPANLTSYCTSIQMLKKDADDIYQPFDPDITQPVGRTTVVDPNAARSRDLWYLLIKTGAIQPPPGPFCVPATNTLALGNVSSNVTTSTITVQNTGADNALTISGITAPVGYTAVMSNNVIAPQTSEVLTVTFDATALAAGVYAGNIEISHNGVAPTVAPTNIAVSATVIDAAIAPVPAIAFGVVPYPQVRNQVVALTNLSPLRAVSISGITAPTGFSVSPITSIAAGATVNVTVTFTTQVTGGVQSGNIEIAGNAPAAIAVSGTSQVQGGKLALDAASITVLDNSYNGVGDANGGPTTDGYYTATIGLHEYSGAPLKNIQFTVKTNGKVIAYKLTKSAIVAGWNLSSLIMRGSVQPDGSSIDSINVVLWSLGAAVLDTTGIAAGPLPLLTFGFDVVNINVDQTTTTMELTKILGSTSTFVDAQLNTEASELVTINNRIQRGDVNNDDRVDILDLLMIVDHITGKAPLTGDAFTAADLAGGPTPLVWPNPDANVDVRDLAQLQDIILDNRYPDGNPLLQMAPSFAVTESLEKTSAAKLTVYAGEKNTLVFELTSSGQLRGFQIKVRGVQSGGFANEELTGYACKREGNTMSVLIKSTEPIQAGTVQIARIPTIYRQADLELAEVLGADANLNAISIDAAISYEKAPTQNNKEVPTEYNLSQNYPNPFNPTTKINYDVKELSHVRIAIYNILGQEVAVLVNGELAAGKYSKEWNGIDASGKALSTGTYIYRMTAGNFVVTKKMMFVK